MKQSEVDCLREALYHWRKKLQVRHSDLFSWDAECRLLRLRHERVIAAAVTGRVDGCQTIAGFPVPVSSR